MDKQQFAAREASLNYLIGVLENEYTWMNSVKLKPEETMGSVNSSRLLALGEALSTKRKGTLSEYFETWYAAFKDFESLEGSGSRPSQMRRVFRRTSRSSTSSSASASTAPTNSNIPTPPFKLDGRVVYLCLCQTVLVMYEAISELSQNAWTPEEQQLYARLDNKIVQHIIMPGVKTFEGETQSIVEKERRLLRFLRS